MVGSRLPFMHSFFIIKLGNRYKGSKHQKEKEKKKEKRVGSLISDPKQK
jgi:hypothetical protein